MIRRQRKRGDRSGGRSGLKAPLSAAMPTAPSCATSSNSNGVGTLRKRAVVVHDMRKLGYLILRHLFPSTTNNNLNMATRTSFENSNEIGVFAALTNAYCLTGE